MTKEYTSLGLMSGTSGDGVDASIIQSDGNTRYQVIKDQYFKYDEQIYQNIPHLFEKNVTIDSTCHQYNTYQKTCLRTGSCRSNLDSKKTHGHYVLIKRTKFIKTFNIYLKKKRYY